jgi:SCP-2 sterol transfer family
MTWQGGKLRRVDAPSSPFAPLKPLAADGDDPAKGIEMLSHALADFPEPLRLHVRLVSAGDDDEVVEHWEVQAGPKGARAQQKEPDGADVIVVMRPETWVEIAQGRLAPYEALYTGRLRVGGDFEAAKAITRHLSDPSSTYVAPC